MRNVMKKAWEIARDGVRKFGGNVKEYFAEALRMAWTIVKSGMETVQLVGTEKQVKWAEDIRKELVEMYEATKTAFIEKRKENGRWEKDGAKHEAAMIEIEKIFNNDSAKFYIEKFGYAGSKEYVLREMATKVCEENSLSRIFSTKIGMY